eukprot:jgi/Psemu1/178255/e_gw1.4.331.1
MFIPKRASRLAKTSTEAYGSFGGAFYDDTKTSKSSLRWEIGAISECGVRESNEDSYILTNDLLNAFDSDSYGTQPQEAWKEDETDHSIGLFGIFDGHCGNQGARFAVEQLGRFIHSDPSNMESILREAIVKMDDEFCSLCQEGGREWESGATALVAMLANENLVIASLGDCRGFLCRFVDDAESYRCFWREVTTVHSPSAEKERARIEKAQDSLPSEDSSLWETTLFLPYPENHDRLFRGDLVTNTPDFHRIRVGQEGVSMEFLLLACDGLWDVMDADDAVRIVRDLLYRKKVTAKKAAARLAELAVHLGSSDNITVVLVRLFSRDDRINIKK